MHAEISAGRCDPGSRTAAAVVSGILLEGGTPLHPGPPLQGDCALEYLTWPNGRRPCHLQIWRIAAKICSLNIPWNILGTPSTSWPMLMAASVACGSTHAWTPVGITKIALAKAFLCHAESSLQHNLMASRLCEIAYSSVYILAVLLIMRYVTVTCNSGWHWQASDFRISPREEA